MRSTLDDPASGVWIVFRDGRRRSDPQPRSASAIRRDVFDGSSAHGSRTTTSFRQACESVQSLIAAARPPGCAQCPEASSLTTKVLELHGLAGAALVPVALEFAC